MSRSLPTPSGAVVLAGRRGGADPLAQAAGARHRALLDIEGEPMLVRVVRRLLGRPGLNRLVVNIDTPDLVEALPEWSEIAGDGRVRLLESTDSPSRSVLESLVVAGLDEGPILVTTADHALLDDAMLDAFLADCPADTDLCLGLVPSERIRERFPEAKRTYLPFRDERYSGANLFFFRTPAARRAAALWQRVESDRKQPWKLARAFGLMNLALFATRRLDLAGAMARASRVIGARVTAVPLPIAEAAVDVDKIEDLRLVREILASRSSAQTDQSSRGSSIATNPPRSGS